LSWDRLTSQLATKLEISTSSEEEEEENDFDEDEDQVTPNQQGCSKQTKHQLQTSPFSSHAKWEKYPAIVTTHCWPHIASHNGDATIPNASTPHSSSLHQCGQTDCHLQGQQWTSPHPPTHQKLLPAPENVNSPAVINSVPP